jgi:hypothetical protein
MERSEHVCRDKIFSRKLWDSSKYSIILMGTGRAIHYKTSICSNVGASTLFISPISSREENRGNT